MKYGIKASRTTIDVKNAGINDLIMHSEYPMFKYHGIYTSSVIFNPGDSTKTTSITHGLGYVPSFLAYGVRSDDNATFIIPSLPYGDTSPDNYTVVWADTDKIYFKTNITNGWNRWNSANFYSDTAYFDLAVNDFPDPGDWFGVVFGRPSGWDGKSSAWRIQDVDINKNESLTAATLEINHIFTVGSQDTKYLVFGIDEDNCPSNFSTSSTKTSASDARNQSAIGGYWNFGTDVLDQVNEIISRNGWQYGNDMGFILNDNSSPDGNWLGANESCYCSLNILKSGNLTVNYKVIVFKDKIHS